MWLPYTVFRELYLMQVREYVMATSDSTTFMRYRGDGVEITHPHYPMC